MSISKLTNLSAVNAAMATTYNQAVKAKNANLDDFIKSMELADQAVAKLGKDGSKMIMGMVKAEHNMYSFADIQLKTIGDNSLNSCEAFETLNCIGALLIETEREYKIEEYAANYVTSKNQAKCKAANKAALAKNPNAATIPPIVTPVSVEQLFKVATKRDLQKMMSKNNMLIWDKFRKHVTTDLTKTAIKLGLKKSLSFESDDILTVKLTPVDLPKGKVKKAASGDGDAKTALTIFDDLIKLDKAAQVQLFRLCLGNAATSENLFIAVGALQDPLVVDADQKILEMLGSIKDVEKSTLSPKARKTKIAKINGDIKEVRTTIGKLVDQAISKHLPAVKTEKAA